MKVGLALHAYDLETRAPLGLAEILEDAIRAEANGFDSVWLMDHYFMVRGGQRVAGHDPLVTLAYIASRTSRISLGIMVLCNGFRPISQLAREAAALSDGSRGRFILGLGCGSQPAEHEAFGIPFDHRVSRLEESLAVLRPLLAGASVDHMGRYVQLKDAAIAATAPAAPIWIAAFGPRMMALAARHGDGYISAWHGPDLSGFIAHRDDFEAGLAAAGRRRSEVEVAAGVLVLPTSAGDRDQVLARAARMAPAGDERFVDRIIAGEPEMVADSLTAFCEQGADTVVLSTSPWQFGRLLDNPADRLARVVKLLR